MVPATGTTQGGDYPEFTVIKLDDFLENKPQAPTSENNRADQEQNQSLLRKIIPGSLIALDNLFDIIPLGSTASNAIDLGLKHVVFKGVDPNSSVFKEYIEHLNQKQTKTCCAYGLPLAGNLLKLGVLAKKAVLAIGHLDDKVSGGNNLKTDVTQEDISVEFAKITI